MESKRGLLIFLAIALFFIITSSASAEFLSIQSLVESEWVNAALLFLLVFNFVLMIIRDVFRGNYGASIIISIVIALGSSLGLVYYFGAFLSKVGIWLLVIFVVAIALLIFRLGRNNRATGIIFIVLGAASLIWLAFLHKEVCPPLGSLPQNICQVLDVLAIILIIICLIRLLAWLIHLSRRNRQDGQGRNGRDRRDRGDRSGNPGNLAGYVRDRNTSVGISGASVEIHGGNINHSVMTDGSGHYHIPLPGRRNVRGLSLDRRRNYQVVARAAHYDHETHSVLILSGRTTRQDFHLRSTTPGLPQIPRFEAHPNPVNNNGDSTNLRWEVINATEIEIQQAGRRIYHVAGLTGTNTGNHNSGQVRLNPTPFKLIATNAQGHVERDVDVHIGHGGNVNLHIIIHGSGHTNPAAPGPHPYPRTGSVNVVPTPDAGSTFDHWSIRGMPGVVRRDPHNPTSWPLHLQFNWPRFAGMTDIFLEAHFTGGGIGKPNIKLSVNGHQGSVDINSGDDVHLQWLAVRTDEVEIKDIHGGNHGKHPYPAMKTFKIPNVTRDTTYEAIATGPGGTEKAIVHVKIKGGGGGKPIIHHFLPSKDHIDKSGEQIKLKWDVSGAEEIEIHQGSKVIHHLKGLDPLRTNIRTENSDQITSDPTIFKLIAKNKHGSSDHSFDVHIKGGGGGDVELILHVIGKGSVKIHRSSGGTGILTPGVAHPFKRTDRIVLKPSPGHPDFKNWHIKELAMAPTSETLPLRFDHPSLIHHKVINLEAHFSGGSSGGKPTIHDFRPDKHQVEHAGDKVKLHFDVDDAEEIKIEQQHHGQIYHKTGLSGKHKEDHHSEPINNSPTEFRLTATNKHGSVSEIKEVKIRNQPNQNAKRGSARFEIIVGGHPHDGAADVNSTDLRNNNRAHFAVRNSGTGGTLSWQASCSKGLHLNRNHGNLKRGQEQIVTVEVKNRPDRFVPHVTIFGKAGRDAETPRELVGKAIGKAMIHYPVN